MIIHVFLGRTERNAARRMLDFWYGQYRDEMSLAEFLKHCRRGKRTGSEAADFFIVYRDPAPAGKGVPMNGGST
jgi:hypothetical protein